MANDSTKDTAKDTTKDATTGEAAAEGAATTSTAKTAPKAPQSITAHPLFGALPRATALATYAEAKQRTLAVRCAELAETPELPAPGNEWPERVLTVLIPLGVHGALGFAAGAPGPGVLGGAVVATLVTIAAERSRRGALSETDSYWRRHQALTGELEKTNCAGVSVSPLVYFGIGAVAFGLAALACMGLPPLFGQPWPLPVAAGVLALAAACALVQSAEQRWVRHALVRSHGAHVKAELAQAKAQEQAAAAELAQAIEERELARALRLAALAHMPDPDDPQGA